MNEGVRVNGFNTVLGRWKDPSRSTDPIELMDLATAIILTIAMALLLVTSAGLVSLFLVAGAPVTYAWLSRSVEAQSTA